MSLDLTIIPTAPLPTWGEVRRHLGLQHVRVREKYGPLLEDGDRFDLERVFSFESTGLDPLFLRAATNASTMLSPADWLDDFGENLADPASVAAAWERAGYYLVLESRSSIGSDDRSLVAHIASAIAAAVTGYVFVESPTAFALRDGTYGPDEFRAAHPLDSGD